MYVAYSIDGHLISHDTEIEQLTHEIEQHDHLMDDTAFSEQLRMYAITFPLYTTRSDFNDF